MSKLHAVQMSEGWWLLLIEACKTLALELSAKQNLTKADQVTIAAFVMIHDQIAVTIGATEKRLTQEVRDKCAQLVKQAIKGDYVN